MYEITKELIGGKEKITIWFQSQTGNFASGVFECRVLKEE